MMLPSWAWYKNVYLDCMLFLFCHQVGFVQYVNAWLSLDPNPGTAAQGFIRAVDNFAWSIDMYFVPVVIWFISFNRDHRFIVTIRFISSNDVLVYVYIFFHVILSVVPAVRCCASITAYAPNSGPHLVSVVTRQVLFSLYQDNPGCQILSSSYPQLAACGLLLVA